MIDLIPIVLKKTQSQSDVSVCDNLVSHNTKVMLAGFGANGTFILLDSTWYGYAVPVSQFNADLGRRLTLSDQYFGHVYDWFEYYPYVSSLNYVDPENEI